MKLINILILIVFPVFITCSQVSHPVVIGMVKENDKALPGVNIRLLKNNIEADNVTAPLNGKFTFTLNAEEQYTIEFQKQGYILQKVFISTKTNGKNSEGFLPFNFSVNMLRHVNGIDTSFFQKPVMKIRFDSKQRGLVTDEPYALTMKPGLDKIKTKLLLLYGKAFTEKVSEGDRYYKNKEYENAWLSYSGALNYKHDDPGIKSKIEEIKKIIFSRATREQAFKAAVNAGDKLFNSNNSEARRNYEKALLYQPDAKYPSEKIREIDEALNQFGFMKKQSLNGKLTRAEYLYKNRDYREALALYQEARSLNPADQAVSKRIEELKKLVESVPAGNDTGTGGSMSLEELLKDLEKKEKTGDKKAIAEVLATLGNKYHEQGSFNKSLDCMARSLEIAEETSDKKTVLLLQQQTGDIYASSYNYEKAIEYYERSLITAGNSAEGKEITLNKIGTMWYQQKQYAKAIDFYEKSLEINEKRGDRKNFASSLNNIGVAYYESGNYEKAVEHYEKALRVLEEIGLKKEISMSLNNLGNVNFDWKKFNKALDYYQKSLKYKEEIRYEKGIVISLYNIGKVYVEMSDYKNAIEFFTNSKDIAGKISLLPFVFLNNKALASVYYKLKDFRKAYDLLNEAKTTNESIFESDLTKQLSEMHYSYDAKAERDMKIESLEKKVVEQNLWVQFLNEKKQRDDELYKKQKQIQKLKLRTEKIISYSLLAGFVLIGIIALVFFNRYRIKKKANAELETANNEILKEKNKSDKLILNVLPAKVAADLKEKGKTEPELYRDTSVMFIDIVKFTEIAAQHPPQEIIKELNEYFSGIDEIIEKHQCERIKTMGDAYLAVCGMPVANESYLENIAGAALAVIKFTAERNEISPVPWEVRIGIHSGEVVGGVVGKKKYIFDVFGDTINTASRMESNCLPMKINVTDVVCKGLENKFIFTDRGIVHCKGKGEMNMFFLEKEKI